jgi:quinol monooxygenase YgiN
MWRNDAFSKWLPGMIKGVSIPRRVPHLKELGDFQVTSQFHVYVQMVAAQDKSQDLLDALQVLSDASLRTKYCSRFDVMTSSLDPGTFHLFESFDSKETYPEHVRTRHAQHFLNFVIPNLVAERSVFFLENSNFTS